MKLIVCASLAVFIAIPAQAQVIEIGAGGTIQTYDGPALFTEEGATSLVPSSQPAASVAPEALLAETAQRHGVDPALLKAVAWQESRGRMAAVSSKGALGVMQLMPGTAAELGVNPADLADNIRGGAIYLRRQLDRFGSVPLALAAYNAGPGAVIRARGVPPYRETRDYVAKIMQRWRPQTVAAQPPAPVHVTSAVIEVPQL